MKHIERIITDEWPNVIHGAGGGMLPDWDIQRPQKRLNQEPLNHQPNSQYIVSMNSSIVSLYNFH